MEVMQFGFAKTEESVATASESFARDADFYRKTWNSCIVSRQISGNLIIVYCLFSNRLSTFIFHTKTHHEIGLILTGQLPKKWWILHF
jgi:hypothetical protein